MLKALKLPVVSGSGANLKKKLIDAKSSKRPIRTLTIMVAIFIILDLRVRKNIIYLLVISQVWFLLKNQMLLFELIC